MFERGPHPRPRSRRTGKGEAETSAAFPAPPRPLPRYRERGLGGEGPAYTAGGGCPATRWRRCMYMRPPTAPSPNSTTSAPIQTIAGGPEDSSGFELVAVPGLAAAAVDGGPDPGVPSA